MPRTELESDLAYVRELAEAGARAPQLGGRFLVWWGLLAAATMTTHYLIYVRVLEWPVWSLPALWFSFGVVGSIGSAVLGRSIANKPGVGAVPNRVEAALWLGVNAGLLSYVAGVIAGVTTGALGEVFFNTILPVAFVGYGIVWVTLAQIARSGLFLLPGVAALAGAVAAVVTVTTPSVYLVGAVTAFASTVIPGVLFLMNEPKDVV